ncbi:MAG: AAA family ATPase [Planctomycetaceae bacterium]|nr:AAA family ATPase [Planctomycetaceae bacterium]
MLDQANQLRQLVRRGTRTGQVRAPHWLTVCGGKGGVGTTTVALGIAAALARSGRRVLLVDGDFGGPDLAALTATDPRYTLVDVLASRRSVHEALEAGPHGMQLLLGPPRDAETVECSPAAQVRLIDQLRQLGAHTDDIVVDAGASPSRATRSFWQAADELLVVMTGDPLAVTDSYAVLKQLYTREPGQQVHAVVNLADAGGEATAVGARFAETCRRFLALSLATVTTVPRDSLAGAPLAARDAQPGSRSSRALEQWVERWLARCEPAALNSTAVAASGCAAARERSH